MKGKMRKKGWTMALSVVLVLIAFGIMAPAGAAEKSGRDGQSPMMAASFASKEIYPGDTWKIYLKASDPDGDMAYVYSVIQQPGAGVHRVSITRVKEDQRKDLSGYIFLNTRSTPSLYFSTLQLEVYIRDRAGHFSPPLVVPLYFSPRAEMMTPASGAFPEKNLGPIMVDLETIGP